MCAYFPFDSRAEFGIPDHCLSFYITGFMFCSRLLQWFGLKHLVCCLVRMQYFAAAHSVFCFVLLFDIENK